MIKPKVTVLLPVYNAEPFLKEAIESILDQSLTDFEFLIIDDSSTDKSREIIRSFTDKRIRLIVHQKNQNLIASLNEGIALAHAPIIARMDNDDLSDKERLSVQYQFLKNHPDHVIVGAKMKIIDRDGHVLGQQPVFTDNAVMQRAVSVTNIFAHGSVMYRKAAILQCGGYSPKAYLAEDYDLWNRLAKLGKVANIARPLYLWRVNPGGMSLKNAARQRARLQQIRDKVWGEYGKDGPAPPGVWSDIWPVPRKDYDPQSRQLYSDLHIQFARAYYGHRQPLLALRHLVAALQMNPVNPIYYGYLTMLILPRSRFFALEEWAFTMRQRRRGW